MKIKIGAGMFMLLTGVLMAVIGAILYELGTHPYVLLGFGYTVGF